MRSFLELNNINILIITTILLINLSKNNNNLIDNTHIAFILIKNNFLEIYLNLIQQEFIDNITFEIVFDFIIHYFKVYTFKTSIEYNNLIEENFNHNFKSFINTFKKVFLGCDNQMKIKSLANFYSICSFLISKENFFKLLIESKIIKDFLILLNDDFDEIEIYVKILVKLFGLLISHNKIFINYMLEDIKLIDILYSIYEKFFSYLNIRKIIFCVLLKICNYFEEGISIILRSSFIKEIKKEISLHNGECMSILINILCILSLLSNRDEFIYYNNFYSKKLLKVLLNLIDKKNVDDIFVFELILNIFENFQNTYNSIILQKDKYKKEIIADDVLQEENF